MNKFNQIIQEVDISRLSEKSFSLYCVGALVLTLDKKILLQEIVDARPFFPVGSLTTFGGKLEKNESSPEKTLIRELHEELGAQVNLEDAIYLGSITEKITNYSELIYTYFWHDKLGTISGCYEDKAHYFNCAKEVLDNPKVTDDVKWMIRKCLDKNLLVLNNP